MKSKRFATPNNLIWLVDDDAEDICVGLRKQVRKIGNLAVQPFSTARVAHHALLMAKTNPLAIVLDRIGTKETTRRSSVVREARKRTPLSVLVLYSFSAYEDLTFIPELKRRRLIDVDVPKLDPIGSLLAVIKKCYDRWNLPLLRKLRRTILGTRDPATPYFPGDDGRFLSLLDLYREILLETDQGKEASKDWELVFSDNPYQLMLSKSHGT